MPNELTVDGISTSTYAELLTLYTEAAQWIYGDDIVLTSNTQDGQWISIFIQSVLDVEDLLVQVFNSFDPDNAIGVVLDQRVAINGLQRLGGTFTITNVTIVNSASVNLYGVDQAAQPIYTVSDSAGNLFELIGTELGLAAGTHALAFRATSPGARVTTPNTITTPITIVLGVTSVNNPTTYTSLGIDEESDAALRIRRQQSVSISSQGYRDGLIAALLNINGVTSVQVYENDTGATSTGTVPAGVPANIPEHSIWVIVAGTPAPALAQAWSAVVEYSYGALASSAGVNYISVQNTNLNHLVSDTAYWSVHSPIAQAIYAKRNAGCGMYGVVSYAIIQKDGVPFLVYWDTVTPEDLYIEFTVGSLDNVVPPDVAGIRAGLVTSYVPGVNQEVDITSLGTAVQAIDTNSFMTAAGFALVSGGPFTNNTLSPSAPTKQFAVSEANIIILPILLVGGAGTTGIGYNINATTGVVTNTTLSIANGGTTFQFDAIGGFGAYTYSVFSGPGSISAGGLYTSGIAGTAVVKVVDANLNAATCTVTVT